MLKLMYGPHSTVSSLWFKKNLIQSIGELNDLCEDFDKQPSFDLNHRSMFESFHFCKNVLEQVRCCRIGCRSSLTFEVLR